MPPRKRKAPSYPPELAVTRRRVADLLLDPANARQHPQRNLDAIRASLRQFGQQKPIVISTEDIVIAGNGTLEAARAEEWDRVDCVVFTGTPEEARAYAIADNRTGELSVWDPTLLLESLRVIEAADLLGATDFTPNEMQDLLASITAPPEPSAGDAFPEYGEDIPTEHECPRCGYEWSGKG